jgi:hypothetical protein
MFDLHRVHAAPVLHGLQKLWFWTPLRVTWLKFHLVHMVCRFFLQRMAHIMMKVRGPHLGGHKA